MKKTSNDLNFIHDMLCKLDDRLDTVDRQLHSLDKTADLQRQSLDYHIKRTNLLEKSLEPIQAHVSKLETIFTAVAKLAGGVLILVSIWAAVRG